MRIYWIFRVLFFWLQSCSISKDAAMTGKKYSPAQLQKDYNIFETMLEQSHPGLYWYTSKDSMDMYFSKYYNAIGDSMTEQQFTWHILAPLIDKIHCGHTSVSMSKAYGKWARGRRLPSFPPRQRCRCTRAAHRGHRGSIRSRSPRARRT